MKLTVKKAVLITRTLYGLLLVAFALDYFLPLPFLASLSPTARQMTGGAAALLAALRESGYLMTLVKAIELLFGLCLLAGYFAPLALAFLAPVVVNIVLFHLFLDPGGLPLALVLAVLQLFLMWGYRDYFEELIQLKPQVW